MVCPSPLRSNQAFSLASTVQHEVVFDDRSREHLVPLYPATIQLPKDTALFWPPEGPSNNGHLMVHQSTAPTSVISLTDAFSPSSCKCQQIDDVLHALSVNVSVAKAQISPVARPTPSHFCRETLASSTTWYVASPSTGVQA
jgi:hypothetical protein